MALTVVDRAMQGKSFPALSHLLRLLRSFADSFYRVCRLFCSPWSRGALSRHRPRLALGRPSNSPIRRRTRRGPHPADRQSRGQAGEDHPRGQCESRGDETGFGERSCCQGGQVDALSGARRGQERRLYSISSGFHSFCPRIFFFFLFSCDLMTNCNDLSDLQRQDSASHSSLNYEIGSTRRGVWRSLQTMTC
jgi:hypothetical protein